MRARHRHFNPAHAGAAFCLDARYGFSQADNTAVSSWKDRTNNNLDADQAVAAHQPKFRKAIQGGSPAIEFQGVANSKDRLNGSVVITNNVITTIAVVRLGLGGSAPNFARVIGLSKNNLNDYDSVTRCVPITRNSSNSQLMTQRSGTISPVVNISLNTWLHCSSTFNGSTTVLRLNETTSASQNSTGNLDISQYRIGDAFDNTGSENNTTGSWTGFMGGVSLYNSALSAALRKRAQFANAFAFKISCN